MLRRKRDAIAGTAAQEVEAVRQASLHAVNHAAEKLRREAEAHCAMANTDAAARIGAVEVEAEALHTQLLAKQSNEFSTHLESNNHELGEAGVEFEAVRAQMRALRMDCERVK